MRLMSTSTKKKGFNKAQLINIVGLPVAAIILFVFLPTFSPGEIHSIDYYDRKNLEAERVKREARKAQMSQ